jgi:2-haloacid dehalogenase
VPLNGVRALLFDLFGTVVDWRSGVAREAAPFLRQHGAASVDLFTESRAQNLRGG